MTLCFDKFFTQLRTERYERAKVLTLIGCFELKLSSHQQNFARTLTVALCVFEISDSNLKLTNLKKCLKVPKVPKQQRKISDIPDP